MRSPYLLAVQRIDGLQVRGGRGSSRFNGTQDDMLPPPKVNDRARGCIIHKESFTEKRSPYLGEMLKLAAIIAQLL